MLLKSLSASLLALGLLGTASSELPDSLTQPAPSVAQVEVQTEEMATPICCLKRAYCCSVRRSCCSVRRSCCRGKTAVSRDR